MRTTTLGQSRDLLEVAPVLGWGGYDARRRKPHLRKTRNEIRPAVMVRPLRKEEIAPLAEAIVEISEAQVSNRWREQELGYRELLVAELDSALVGTVSISNSGADARTMHLFALEVAPDIRSRGVGTAIVKYVCDEARRRGCDRVYLEVRVDNPARRLYHRLGFRRIGGAFINPWWQFNADGTRDRVEESSYRMMKRLRR